MKLTREDIAGVAMLSRLGITEEEAKRAEQDLEAILGYVDRLQKIDTSGVVESSSPLAHADDFRSDSVTDCPAEDRELIMKNFPAKHQNLLKVPAVFLQPKK